jgi:hypothetical protein
MSGVRVDVTSVAVRHPLVDLMSKNEAAAIRDRIRADIREGRLPGQGSVVPEPPTDPRLTFGDVADRYLRQYVWIPTRRSAAAK